MQKVMLFIGILMVGNIVMAQGKQQEKQRAEVKLEEYKERLNLSDEQIDQWKDLKEKYKPELKSIRSDESKSKADKMRAAADVIDKKEEELANILSENQFAELQIIRNEEKQKMKESRVKSQRGKG
jgi:hypothetical protein